MNPRSLILTLEILSIELTGTNQDTNQGQLLDFVVKVTYHLFYMVVLVVLVEEGILSCVWQYVNYFPSVKYFQVKIFLGKENIFKCLVVS